MKPRIIKNKRKGKGMKGKGERKGNERKGKGERKEEKERKGGKERKEKERGKGPTEKDRGGTNHSYYITPVTHWLSVIIFRNIFETQTLLTSSFFWFYKFTSENVCRILILITVHQKPRWANYGRFYPEVCSFWLKSIRASFPCKNHHLWKMVYTYGPIAETQFSHWLS